jgi:hypothetical protein
MLLAGLRADNRPRRQLGVSPYVSATSGAWQGGVVQAEAGELSAADAPGESGWCFLSGRGERAAERPKGQGCGAGAQASRPAEIMHGPASPAAAAASSPRGRLSIVPPATDQPWLTGAWRMGMSRLPLRIAFFTSPMALEMRISRARLGAVVRPVSGRRRSGFRLPARSCRRKGP